MNRTKRELLSKLGVFLQEQFLDSDTCKLLHEQMQVSDHIIGKVYEKNVPVVNFERRITDIKKVTEAVASTVGQRLSGNLGIIEQFFRCGPLTLSIRPRFLEYKTGYFNKPHADRNESNCAPIEIRRREITFVCFVNPQSKNPVPGTYGGGNLVLYGLFPNEALKNQGWPIAERPGTLVAFRSSVLHEVQRVTHGTRFVVTGHYAL